MSIEPVSPESPTELLNTLQDLPPISTFEPTGVRLELLSQIDEYLREINDLRDRNKGLDASLVEKIEANFLADRVRHSATIEGSTLDRRETLHVLLTGQIIEGKRRPSEEVKNLGEALKDAGELISVDLIREVDIRHLHRTLLRGLDPHAGRYRPHDVRITNATYRPPEHLDVPRLMQQLVANVEAAEKDRSAHGFTIGTYCHWCIARIHPFSDGNGRMARVLQDLFFLRHKLVPAPIPFQQVDEYYESLQEADSGKPDSFIELVANATLDSLKKYRAAIEEFKQTDDWLSALITTVSESVRDRERAIYARYMQRVGEFRETLRSICETLASHVPEVKIRFRNYGGIDLSQYRQLKQSGRAPRTWDFGIDFQYADRSIRAIFWHGRYSFPTEPDATPASNAPVLMLSLDDGGFFRTLDDLDEQGISLRSVAVEDGSFIRARANPLSEQIEFDFGISSAAIARDFIQELLRSKFGIG